jgi:hypothetical protein
VPILKGAAKIWAVLRFEPPKAADGAEIIDAHLVKGNVKRLDARFRILKIDDENTELDLNMTIVPDLPIPESLITDEASYASDVAVTGSRDRAERNYAAAKKK